MCLINLSSPHPPQCLQKRVTRRTNQRTASQQREEGDIPRRQMQNQMNWSPVSLHPSLPHTTIYIRNARQISRAIDNWNDDEVRWASCRWNLFLAKGASKKIARNYNQFFLPSADIFIINGGEEWKCLHSSVSGRIIIFNLAPFGAIHRGKVVEEAVDSALISVRRWARR